MNRPGQSLVSLDHLDKRNLRHTVFLGILCSALSLHCQASFAQEATSITKTAAISGTVSYEEGRLATERIVAYRMTAQHGHRQLERGCSTFTNSEGHYVCKHLQAGHYLVVAENGNTRKASMAAKLAPFIFYGGSQDLNNIVLISVGPNEIQTADFQVPYSSGQVVSGTLLPGNRTATIGLFQTADSGIEYRSPIQADYSKDGTFQFTNVPAGHYQLRERWFDGPQELDASEALDIAGSGRTRLRMSPYHLRNVSVILTQEGSSSNPIDSVLAEEIRTGSHEEADAKKSPVVLKEMKPGDYNLFVTSDHPVCVQGIAVNGRDTLLPLHIPEDDSPIEVEVHVGALCGSIQGAFSSGGRGDLLVTTENLVAVKAVRSDSFGRFKADNLPVGRYLLFAWPSLQEVPFRDRSYLAGYKDKSVSVQVDPQAPLSALTVAMLD